MKIDFQRAVPADMARLYPVELAAFPEVAWPRDVFERALGDPTNEFEMALKDGRPVGYSLFNHESHVVESLAVDPSAQGNKIGEQLLLRSLERADSAHYDSVQLQVEVGNTRAEKLYAKYGFVPTKILSNYYGPGKDGTEMQLKPLDHERLVERRQQLEALLGGFPSNK